MSSVSATDRNSAISPSSNAWRLLVVAGCVAVVVAVAVVLIVRFGPRQQLPDTRPLLLPVPADAVACGRNGELFSADRLAHADGVPAAVAQSVNGSGLLSVAYRCWLQLGGSEVDIMLMRFDTAEHAAHSVPASQTAALPGVVNMAEVPGLDGARSFRLAALPDRLWVMGARGTTAFAVLGTVGSGMDADAIDEVAVAQYARL